MTIYKEQALEWFKMMIDQNDDPDIESYVKSLIEQHAPEEPVVEPWDEVPEEIGRLFVLDGFGGVCQGSVDMTERLIHGNAGTEQEMQARARTLRAEALIVRWCKHLWNIEPKSAAYFYPYRQSIFDWKNMGIGMNPNIPDRLCAPFNPTREHQGRIWLTDEIKEAYRVWFNGGVE